MIHFFPDNKRSRIPLFPQIVSQPPSINSSRASIRHGRFASFLQPLHLAPLSLSFHPRVVFRFEDFPPSPNPNVCFIYRSTHSFYLVHERSSFMNQKLYLYRTCFHFPPPTRLVFELSFLWTEYAVFIPGHFLLQYDVISFWLAFARLLPTVFHCLFHGNAPHNGLCPMCLSEVYVTLLRYVTK